MSKTVYETLTEATGVMPEDGEAEQDFLVRLKKGIDGLDEAAFEALPEAAQDWSNEAYSAGVQKQPFQVLPGSPWDQPDSTEDDDEDSTEAQAAEEDEESTDTSPDDSAADEPPAKETAPPRKKADAPKSTGKNGKAGKSAAPAKKPGKNGGSKAAEKPAAASKPAAEAPAPKSSKPKADKDLGVLDMLMEVALANPAAKPADLKAAAEKKYKGVEFKDANVIGIRQQFRRWVKFFQQHDLLKKKIEV